MDRLRLGNVIKAFRFEGFTLDVARGCLRAEDREIELRPKSFQLLHYLVANADRLVGKDELMTAVWPGVIVTDDSLKRCVSDVRLALGDHAQQIVKTSPRRGYRFAAAVTPHEDAEPVPTAAPPESGVTPELPDRPSIAVLPFNNFSGDPNQEYLCDGIAEDIITELSRFRELFVIARNSSFQYKGKSADVREIGRKLGVRYVLEGSVQRSGSSIRITAQLVDAVSGIHRWAERYHRELENVFAVQDEVTWAIVATLAAHVTQAERERTRAKPPATWQAYDYYLKAGETFALFRSTRTKKDLYEIRHLLEQSLAIDPNFARAYGRLAVTYLAAWHHRFDDDFLSPDVVERAYQLTRKAAQLDPTSPQVHADVGDMLTWKRDHDASIAAFERAIALNPNFSDGRFANALVFAGDFQRAIRVARAHMRIDPFHPPPVMAFSGPAQYMLREYPEAMAQLREHLSRRPNNRAAHTWLAATYARMGRLEEARAEAAAVLRLLPSYTIQGVARVLLPFKHPEHAKHAFEGLRLAGIPER